MSEHPRKVGTATTINAETGEIESVRQNAFTLMPCAPDKCQECAVGHAYYQPHNQQSLYCQYRFFGAHGRWPTWSDAMIHCTPEVRAKWREHLVKLMTEKGLPVPDDLKEDNTVTRR